MRETGVATLDSGRRTADKMDAINSECLCAWTLRGSPLHSYLSVSDFTTRGRSDGQTKMMEWNTIISLSRQMFCSCVHGGQSDWVCNIQKKSLVEMMVKSGAKSFEHIVCLAKRL